MTDKELMQQALEALEWHENAWSAYRYAPAEISQTTIDALRDRLVQQGQEPVTYTTGHCEQHKQNGGCQLHNLQCGWPDCDRKPISTPPKMQPCAGRNCGSTNPNLHSAECFEDYEKSTGMSQWQSLTEEEINNSYLFWVVDQQDVVGFGKSLETKLKRKNI